MAIRLPDRQARFYPMFHVKHKPLETRFFIPNRGGWISYTRARVGAQGYGCRLLVEAPPSSTPKIPSTVHHRECVCVRAYMRARTRYPLPCPCP